MNQTVFPVLALAAIAVLVGACGSKTGLLSPPLVCGALATAQAITGRPCVVGDGGRSDPTAPECEGAVCFVPIDRTGPGGFCSCECGGAGDRSRFVTCQEHYQCTTEFIAGQPPVRGAFCLHDP